MRIYIDVVCSFSKTGAIRPLYIRWNKCTVYNITKINRITPQKNEGTSRLLFNCMIGNNERDLYLEGGKWYIEKNELYN